MQILMGYSSNNAPDPGAPPPVPPMPSMPAPVAPIVSSNPFDEAVSKYNCPFRGLFMFLFPNADVLIHYTRAARTNSTDSSRSSIFKWKSLPDTSE